MPEGSGVALLTGAGSGFGRAIAVALATPTQRESHRNDEKMLLARLAQRYPPTCAGPVSSVDACDMVARG